MTGIEGLGGSGDELVVADILGDSYDSPIELADAMSEGEISNHIAALSAERLAVDADIAMLEAKRHRLRGQSLIAQEALRIARDRGLE